MEPCRLPKTNVDTETAFRHNHCMTRVHIQKVNISEVRVQLIRSNSEVRVHAALNLDIVNAGQSPNAVSVHTGTSQVDFEVDRQLVHPEIF